MSTVTGYPQSKQEVHREQGHRARLWHVVAVVLTPLTLLALLVAVTFVGTAFMRSLTASYGFFIQQQDVILVVTIGLILAALSYTLAIIVALRKIDWWHKTNKSKHAIAATWGLGMTAVIVTLPILLSFFIR
jgi:hypothetical protein